MIDGSSSPVFELLRAFIPSLLIYKFQEYMIKTERAMTTCLQTGVIITFDNGKQGY